jgi:long-chain acyl-CoA synthetase
VRAQMEPSQSMKGNLVQLLEERAKEPSKIAARHKKDGAWHDVTWGQILEDVRTLAAGMVAEGLKPGERVAIFAATSLQWVIVDLAISAAGGVTVPIYASNTPEECRYVLNNSESVFLFVDNDLMEGKQAGRATRIRARIAECPSVRKVILFEGAPQGEREEPLTTMVARGQQAKATDAFDARVAAIAPDAAACFIYTSGTTGDPKGVILSHGNWTYEADSVRKLELIRPDDSVLLFLPLAHSFAQVIKVAWLGMGFQMVFAESVDKLLANLAETHPTILPSVPRVFEKVYNNVIQNGSVAPGLKGKLFRWSFRLFDEYVDAKNQGREYNSLGFALAQKLVFTKVKATLDERLGGNMRLFISGGAPLSKKIAYFFDLIGFRVLEGYGLTETSAATTVNRPDKIKIGTVGAPLPGSEIKIAPDGEIMIRGPGVMKGYYKNEAATAEALEPDGWFHSGDIGEVDADGYVRITDRKKDIIVTAGGKNVAPQNLENQLKTYPIISQTMVYGDKRKYLSLLVCINEDNARKLLTDKGITPPATYAELAERPEIREEVQKAIDAVNAEQPSYQTLKRFHLMDHDFTQETGELTPTMKVKRKFATQKYKTLLDAMYDGETVD